MAGIDFEIGNERFVDRSVGFGEECINIGIDDLLELFNGKVDFFVDGMVFGFEYRFWYMGTNQRLYFLYEHHIVLHKITFGLIIENRFEFGNIFGFVLEKAG